MSALGLGDRVTIEGDDGHWLEGQVWSLHSEANWYWIIDADGRTYARKRSGIVSMQQGWAQDALPARISATPDMQHSHMQLSL